MRYRYTPLTLLVKKKSLPFKTIVSAVALCALTALMAVSMIIPRQSLQKKPLTFEDKAHALGIKTNWPRQIAERHVWISEHAGIAFKSRSFAPVHILYRRLSTDKWSFNGTGTLLLKRPGYLVTAHHVLENRRGQYGAAFL